jgi:hypothetical protein
MHLKPVSPGLRLPSLNRVAVLPDAVVGEDEVPGSPGVVRVVCGGAERGVFALPDEEGGHQEGSEWRGGPKGPYSPPVGCFEQAMI